MTTHIQIPPRVYVLIGWIGGIVATVIGSWLASKIRVYHDSRKSHHDELKSKVLTPLRDVLAANLQVFRHQAGVVSEAWDRLSYTRDARAEEDAGRHGSVLRIADPWIDAFDSTDRALFQDAKDRHYRAILSEVSTLAESWKAHCQRCMNWVSEIADGILKTSKMNSFPSSNTPPYVLHLRLGVFVYRRLFDLPTEALRKQSQGQYWSVEGAPTVPNVIGSASIANESEIERLLEIVNQSIASNRGQASQLKNEAQQIYDRAVELRRKLELAIASKKLHKRCDFVPYL
jgi:uncharacterized protein (DUF2384 family)